MAIKIEDDNQGGGTDELTHGLPRRIKLGIIKLIIKLPQKKRDKPVFDPAVVFE